MKTAASIDGTGVSMQRDEFKVICASKRTGQGRLRNRRGAILLLFAISLFAFMGLLVLVIDHGDIQRQKRMAQAAADAGARAGANEMFRNRPDTEIEPAAVRETARNGFTNGVDAIVTVISRTTSVNAPGSNFVKVIVQRSLPTNFASIFGITSSTIRAQAVAGLGSANTVCLTVTAETEPDALYVKSGSLTTVGCGIMVNSTDAGGVGVLQNGTVTASSVAVVGGPTTKSTGIVAPYASGAPLPPTGPDPLSFLTMPAVGACNGAYGAYEDFGGSTLSPGVYCGGIGINHGGTVTLQPGLYILAGGGLYLKSATVIGNGVTFVNTNAPAANGGAANFGVPAFRKTDPNTAINIEVNSDVRISAMTTGPLAGVLFYGDPAAGIPGTVYTNYLYSSSDVALMGSMYFPTERLQAKSHSDLTINGVVVVRELQINTGQENIVIKGPSAGGIYYPLKQPTIVE